MVTVLALGWIVCHIPTRYWSGTTPVWEIVFGYGGTVIWWNLVRQLGGVALFVVVVLFLFGTFNRKPKAGGDS